jgi:hypothetical protein
MSIVIEFNANTNYEIQIWLIKICCKLYIHKIKTPYFKIKTSYFGEPP